MLEQTILGITQGVAEWLPVSSEGLIFLLKNNFFNSGEGIKEITAQALFLHFGTFLAALLYFRKDVALLVKTLFNYKSSSDENKKLLNFLIISTLISGLLGFAFLETIAEFEDVLIKTSKIINLVIGVLLLITAYLQIKAKKGGEKDLKNIENKDSIILGLTQSCAVLPGLSRSGLTVSALLFRKFNEETALKLSFLMSLPLVLGGNIILNLDKFNFSTASLVGMLFSFVFGFLTIGALLKVTKKVNFGYFVLVFAFLMIFSVFV